MSPCHPAALSHCHPAALSSCHCATPQPCPRVTLRVCHPLAVSPCQPAALSSCHPAGLAPHSPVPVSPSPCRFVTCSAVPVSLQGCHPTAVSLCPLQVCHLQRCHRTSPHRCHSGPTESSLTPNPALLHPPHPRPWIPLPTTLQLLEDLGDLIIKIVNDINRLIKTPAWCLPGILRCCRSLPGETLSKNTHWSPRNDEKRREYMKEEKLMGKCGEVRRNVGNHGKTCENIGKCGEEW